MRRARRGAAVSRAEPHPFVRSRANEQPSSGWASGSEAASIRTLYGGRYLRVLCHRMRERPPRRLGPGGRGRTQRHAAVASPRPRGWTARERPSGSIRLAHGQMCVWSARGAAVQAASYPLSRLPRSRDRMAQLARHLRGTLLACRWFGNGLSTYASRFQVVRTKYAPSS